MIIAAFSAPISACVSALFFPPTSDQRDGFVFFEQYSPLVLELLFTYPHVRICVSYIFVQLVFDLKLDSQILRY
jgi:hypothetical protein